MKKLFCGSCAFKVVVDDRNTNVNFMSIIAVAENRGEATGMALAKAA